MVMGLNALAGAAGGLLGGGGGGQGKIGEDFFAVEIPPPNPVGIPVGAPFLPSQAIPQNDDSQMAMLQQLLLAQRIRELLAQREGQPSQATQRLIRRAEAGEFPTAPPTQLGPGGRIAGPV